MSVVSELEPYENSLANNLPCEFRTAFAILKPKFYGSP
jgi:hypothetical protein